MQHRRTDGASAGTEGPEWRALSLEIEACRRCPLGAVRAHPVIYRGAPRPRVLFVGEAPGVEEDHAGIPFVGRAGKVLDRALEQLDVPASEIGVLNVVKCHPPQNRLPRESVRACQPFLRRQLSLLGPAVVVTLGAHALRSFDPNGPPISDVAGAPRPTSDGTIFPLLHPAAGFRSRRYADRWARDVEKLRRHLAAA